MRRMCIVVAVALAAPAVVGCGGAKQVKVSELIARADPICRRANEALVSSKLNRQNLRTAALQAAATQEQVSIELAKLDVPPSMVSDWRAVVDGYRRASAGLKKLAQIGPLAKDAHVPKSALSAEIEVSKAQEDRALVARRDGFDDCGRF
jgi:hypothetical protein